MKAKPVLVVPPVIYAAFTVAGVIMVPAVVVVEAAPAGNG